MRQEVLSFKAENKNDRNSLTKERFEFQIALLYIISWFGLS
jgi:hypothetical protein